MLHLIANFQRVCIAEIARYVFCKRLCWASAVYEHWGAGHPPAAWHLNEGHAAFLNLERCRELVATGLSFNEAREAVAANSLFTTHTPVPAGNDAFSYDLIDTYFGSTGGNWD